MTFEQIPIRLYMAGPARLTDPICPLHGNGEASIPPLPGSLSPLLSSSRLFLPNPPFSI